MKTKQEEIREGIIPMDGGLHSIGTLMYEDSTIPSNSTAWKPHRNIWRVIAHRECQDYPNAPVRLRCELKLVRQEDL